MTILALPLVIFFLKPPHSRAFSFFRFGKLNPTFLYPKPLLTRRSFSRTAIAAITGTTGEVQKCHSVEPENGTLKSDVPTFQQAIQRLQEYWTSVGCAIMQCSNTEVGASAMNPLTFLRALRPEPWNVAYVEPSIRPDDSRYGENPNKLQRHTQFQVTFSCR